MEIVHPESPYDFADRSRFLIWVEKGESCWEWLGNTDSRGYGRLHLQGKRRGAHVISWEIANGPNPAGNEIDHKCHNTLCVNPEHLRSCTHKQNLEHRQGSNARSGYRGVHQSGRRWRGCVVHNYAKHYTRPFDTPEEANAAVTALRNELFTHNLLDRKV